MPITIGGKPATAYVRCCECGKQWFEEKLPFKQRCKDHPVGRIDMELGSVPDWWLEIDTVIEREKVQ